MELGNINRVYFVGIGGIGMSSLARYFAEQGKLVYGYDKTSSIVTDGLMPLVKSIVFTDSENYINKDVLADLETLVVYTPAIPENSEILNYFINNDYKIVKRAEVLGIISENTFSIAVAGTHGKTTVTSLLGHIMTENNTGASTFVGGIMAGYNSNFILGSKDISVIEADEFDRSFMHLNPNISCITSVDADHLDIYGDAESLINTFSDFASLTHENGVCIAKENLGIENAITYSINGEGDYKAINLRVENYKFIFDIEFENDKNIIVVKNVISNLPGRYNVENTLAAFAMAHNFGLQPDYIVKAIMSFKGVYRRFNTFNYKNKIIVDDYAHHPTEITAVLNACKELYTDKKLMIVFQPHLFSRTRDFEKEFASVLSEFDIVRLLDIYPAREESIDGITSLNLAAKIINTDVGVIDKHEIEKEITEAGSLKNEDIVVLMLGAGDISVEIEKLRDNA